MTISCPECGETLELPIELVGKPVKCPTCGSGFVSDSGVTVPIRQSAPTPSQSPQLPQQTPPPPPTPEELYVAASWSDKYKKAKPRNEAWVRAAWETEAVLDKIYDCGGLPTVSTSFLLNSSDIVHYELPDTEMYETVSSTNQKRRHVGTGTLLLTEKRIVFICGGSIKSIPFREMSTFSTDWLPHKGWLRLSILKKARGISFLTSSPLLCGLVFWYYRDDTFREQIRQYCGIDKLDPRRHETVKLLLGKMTNSVNAEQKAIIERRRQAAEWARRQAKEAAQQAAQRAEEATQQAAQQAEEEKIQKGCLFAIIVGVIIILMAIGFGSRARRSAVPRGWPYPRAAQRSAGVSLALSANNKPQERSATC